MSTKGSKKMTVLVMAVMLAMTAMFTGCSTSNGTVGLGDEFTLGDNTYLFQSVDRPGDSVEITLFVKGDGTIHIGGTLGGGLSVLVPIDMVLGDNDSTAIRANRISLDSNTGSETHKLAMVFEFDTTGVQELTSVATVTDKNNTGNSVLLDISSVGSAGSAPSRHDSSAVIVVLVLLVAAALVAFVILKKKKRGPASTPIETAAPVSAPVEATSTANAIAVETEKPSPDVPDLKPEVQVSSKDQKIYKESDNMGTRHDSMSQATAYWMGERFMNTVKPPFTMYTMPSAESAEEAFLELPFMHKASDSGKLVCERLMTFGLYETTLNGALTGEYEAMLTGRDLTLEEFETLEKAFESRGGKLKNHDAPDESVKASVTEGDAGKVVYSETVKGNDGVSTYEVYTGPDKASAMAFLKTRPVTQSLYYIVVDTPEGSFGRDINGFYQE